MANEIFYRLELTARKSGAVVSQNASGNITMTGSEMIQSTQVIGTTSEVINLGEIASAPAMLLVQNLDVTNYVEIGGDSGLTVFKLKIPASKSILISPTSATIYAKANTASCRIQIVAADA
jgi:hypothetical protein